MANRFLGLTLSAVSALLLLTTSATAEVNSSPILTKRDYTPAEIQQVLSKLGVNPLAPSVVACAVNDPTGARTTSVTPWSAGAGSYSLKYIANGVTSTQVDFIVIPLYAGSPLTKQVQTFAPDSSTNIDTPFGIPYWISNLTSGPWALVVVNNAGNSSVCYFKVTT